MKKYVCLLAVLVSVLSLSMASITTFAQDEDEEEITTPCDVDLTTVMETVSQVCTGIGRDQVCYGNVEVNAIARQEQISLDFEEPGDSTDVSLIRSLYLSALDLTNNTWGIAQMRLLANLSDRPQEVTLLLFGDVSIEDASEPRPTLDLLVNPDYSARIRNTPTLNSLILDVAQPNEEVKAIGRLEDNSWIRVEEDELGRVGWVAADLLQLNNVDISVLNIDDAETPYFGAMQALYYQSGTSGACGNVISDGMLIQTPEGVARLTLLINEVSIELLGSSSGATAFVGANPENGMNIDMLEGSANVTVGNTTVFVDTNNSVNVPIDENLTPSGEISTPQLISVETLQNIILVPLIDTIVENLFGNLTGTTGSTGTTDGTTTGTTTGTTDGGTDGDHGCNEPGNACNAPGHTDGNAQGNANGKANGKANGNTKVRF